MEALTPIREAADHFGLPLSTLHFWERRGLLQPHRRAGVRCYDTDQLYRIALIQMWREQGQMSIDEIASLLAADGTAEWRETVAARIAAVEEQRAKLDGARDYLGYLLNCERGGDLERCPGFRERADIPGRRARRAAGARRPQAQARPAAEPASVSVPVSAAAAAAAS